MNKIAASRIVAFRKRSLYHKHRTCRLPDYVFGDTPHQ